MWKYFTLFEFHYTEGLKIKLQSDMILTKKVLKFSGILATVIIDNELILTYDKKVNLNKLLGFE